MPKRLRLVNKQTIENTQKSDRTGEHCLQRKWCCSKKKAQATLTDILLADNAVREAQTSNLSAIIEYLKADLELKKLSGNMSLKN